MVVGRDLCFAASGVAGDDRVHGRTPYNTVVRLQSFKFVHPQYYVKLAVFSDVTI